MSIMSEGKQSDPFACKSRKEWMVEAAKVFIAVTTPNHRYMFLREGFPAFQKPATVLFREHAGLHFTNNEIRKIYDMIAGYCDFKEKHLYAFLERAYQETRARSWKADEEPSADAALDDLIETERVHRGVAEKRAYKGKRRVQ